jgi:RecA-family ATPase
MNAPGAQAEPKLEVVTIAQGFLERLPERVRKAGPADRLAVLCMEAEGLQPYVSGGLLDPAAVAEQISIAADETGLTSTTDAEALAAIVRLATSPDEPESDDSEPPQWFVDTIMSDRAADERDAIVARWEAADTARQPPPHEHIPESNDAEPILEPVNGATAAPANKQRQDKPPPVVAARTRTPQDWPDEAPSYIDWVADQRIPRGDVTTAHGDGGAGKTDIALQLGESVARRAPYWLGHEICGGSVVILSAEEPERELRRRIWLHGKRDGFSPQDLADLHLWFPDDVAGAVFAVPDRSGVMQPTPLFQSIAKAIEEIAPVLVIVDNVAATFTGNQNDRVMVRSYVNLWRRIARQPSRPAVLLLDHPSLSGLTNGTGRGGNMDWRNAVRSALYLRMPDDKAEADRGIRILETVKSNYAAPGKPVRLQWVDGGLALEHAPSSLHRLAKDAECEDTFLRLLDERSAQGRHVSDKNGKNYAPAVFAEMAGSGGFTAKAFAEAMNRLFEARPRKIALRPQRRDGHTRDVLDRAAVNTPSSAQTEAGS